MPKLNKNKNSNNNGNETNEEEGLNVIVIIIVSIAQNNSFFSIEPISRYVLSLYYTEGKFALQAIY